MPISACHKEKRYMAIVTRSDVLVVFLELVEWILWVCTSLRHWLTLEVGHEEVDGGLELFHVHRLHLLEQKPGHRPTLLQYINNTQVKPNLTTGFSHASYPINLTTESVAFSVGYICLFLFCILFTPIKLCIGLFLFSVDVRVLNVVILSISFIYSFSC